MRQIKADFETQVIRGADKDIDKAMGETVDWFIQRNLQIWGRHHGALCKADARRR
ncbi:MAG: hypothetical protein R2880_15270 [Deinococcales bacterium]